MTPSYICGVTGNAGLAAFTESLGSGSVRDGIRVIGVSPGPTATDRVVGLAGKRAQERFGDPSRWPELFKSLPRGGVGEPGRDRRHGRLPGVAEIQQYQRRGRSRSMRAPRRGRDRSKFRLSGCGDMRCLI